MNKQEQTLIHEWIDDTIKNTKWKMDLDLHVDEISKKYENRSQWLSAGLKVLREADIYLSRKYFNPRFISIMFYPLIDGVKLRGNNFKSFKDIQNDFDITPPSLFVCPLAWDNLVVGYSKYWDKWLTNNINDADYDIFYFERLRDDNEYLRYVALTLKDSEITTKNNLAE